MNIRKIISAAFISFTAWSFAQTSITYTVQPDAGAGIDALVDQGAPTTNYSTNTSFKDGRYQSGSWYNRRSYISFDLSSIPANAKVISASLYVYGLNHSGANASYLRKVTSSWTEGGITWNTQPTNTTTGQINMAASSSATQTYTVDVKTFVQEFIDNPVNNYGWVMLLQDETTNTTRGLDFESSDHATSGSRPKLQVVYELPVNIAGTVVHATEGSANDGAIVLNVTQGVSPYTYSWSNSATTKDIYNLAPGVYTVTVTDAQSFTEKKYFIVGRNNTAVTVSLQPDGAAGKDAQTFGFDTPTNADNTNYETYTTMYASRWTSGGWYKARSYIQYDFSSLPANTTVSSASLTLYGTDHSPLNRSNASYLRTVSAAWNEYDIKWSNQPANSSTNQVSLAQSTTSTQNYTLTVTNHAQSMVNNASTNYGWVLLLQDEATASYTKLGFASSDHATAASRPKLDITFTVPATTDNGHNWTLEESFDANGTVIASVKKYTDALGRGTQELAKNSGGNVFAAQSIYDAYGRPALTTLTAPVGTSMVYQENFALNAGGTKYDYNNFDVSSKLNNPDAMLQGISNTLGTYFSDNSSEAYVATSAYPFARTEYTADPTSTVKRASGAGDAFKMGSGHESRNYTMVSGDELRTLFGTNLSYKCSLSPSDKMSNSALNVGTDITATKSVSVSPDGKEVITYEAGGKTIATCMSGLGSPEACTMSTNTLYMLYNGTQSVDIHVPAANVASVKLPLPTYFADESQVTMSASDITYKIVDLNTNTELAITTNYTINSGTRFVTFIGSYVTGSHVYRISCTYSSTFIANLTAANYTIPDAKVQYDLDYGQWSVNYYDLAGGLRKTVTPKGISSCTANGATMFTTYDYSNLGQLIAKKSPDEGLTEMVYDKEGRVRFTQDPVQNAAKKFSYVNYDAHGRAVESGEFSTLNNGSTSSYFNNFYSAYTAPYAGNVSTNTLLDNTDGITDAQCAAVSYTDYNPLISANEIPAAYSYKSSYSGKTKAGQVSRTKNENTTTWYAYDNNDRLVSTVKQINDADWTAINTTANTQIKTMDFVYDAYTGKLKEQYYQKNDTAAKLEHWFTYNTDLQLTKLEIKRGNCAVKETVAQYYYYGTGKLMRTELGVNLQGLDYVYTLNGALKAINHPSLDETKDPGQDGKAGSSHSAFAKDIFGFALEYYDNDYTRTNSNYNTNAQQGDYNGLIHGVRYKTRGTTNSVNNGADYIDYGGPYQNQIITNATQHEFYDHFGYDKFNRLSFAKFQRYNNSTGYIDFYDHYKEFGNNGGGIAYDANGNITSLQRNAYVFCNQTMDNLAYTYTSGTNKLASIIDNAGATACVTTDFEAATSKTFSYNAKGQMTVSQAENVTDVLYYPGGLVKKVTFSTNSNSFTEYFYDDAGQRYKVKYTNNSSGFTKTNWYIYGTVYEQDKSINNNINLKEMTIGGRIAMLKNTSTALAGGEINYELTDHVGNVRATFKRISSGVAQVVMWNDYYVYGGTKPGRSYNPSQYRYTYQGQENCSIDGSNWDMFELRMFNNDLGRWMAPDPAGQFASPYNGMGNNPVNGTDPDGAYFVMGQAPSAVSQANMQRIADNFAKSNTDNYNKAQQQFLMLHGDGYGGVDPMYADAYLKITADYMGAMDLGMAYDDPVLKNQNTGNWTDALDETAGMSDFLKQSYRTFDDMMAGKTTVDVNFFGVTISHAEFDEGSDAELYAGEMQNTYLPSAKKLEDPSAKPSLLGASATSMSNFSSYVGLEGYSTSLYVGFQLWGGYDITITQTWVVFNEGDYAGYPYQYLSISLSERVGPQGSVWAGGQKDFVVGATNSDNHNPHPSTFEGGSNIGGFDLSLGEVLEGTLSATYALSSEWGVFSVGVGAGPALNIFPVEASLKFSYKKENYTWLAPWENVMKTSERTFTDMTQKWTRFGVGAFLPIISF